MVHKISQKVGRWGLEVPALFFLHLMRPVSLLLGNTILFSTPVLNPVFGDERVKHWQNFWNDRRNISALQDQIEADFEEELARRKARREARRCRRAEKRKATLASADHTENGDT